MGQTDGRIALFQNAPQGGGQKTDSKHVNVQSEDVIYLW